MESEVRDALHLFTGKNMQKTRWVPKMFRIIVCDDDQDFLEKLAVLIEKCLAEAGQKCKLHKYTAMEQISNQLLSSCDIAFLILISRASLTTDWILQDNCENPDQTVLLFLSQITSNMHQMVMKYKHFAIC